MGQPSWQHHNYSFTFNTHSTIIHLPQATMKIKKLFSFSSQKSSKSCDSLETILRQPQQQVGSSSGGSGRVKGDIHSEYVINEMLGKGGFGRVFSARRICDGTEVAIKEVVKDARYKTDNKNSLLDEVVASLQPASASLLVMT